MFACLCVAYMRNIERLLESDVSHDERLGGCECENIRYSERHLPMICADA